MSKIYIYITMCLINLEIQTQTHACNTEYLQVPVEDVNTDELP